MHESIRIIEGKQVREQVLGELLHGKKNYCRARYVLDFKCFFTGN